MAKAIMLDYFYGRGAEQFGFYRIPKLLFTDEQFKTISFEAKILYGLMLDRMGLSAINGWLDKENRVFIYFTLENVIKLLGCGHDKAIRLFAELDTQKGIGLIERIKQEQGKPAIIYVKNFNTLTEDNPSINSKPDSTVQGEIISSENPKSTFMEQTDVLSSVNPKSIYRDNRINEFGKPDINNTYYNNTEYINTNQSIYQEDSEYIAEIAKSKDEKQINNIDFFKSYRKIIGQNIEYDILAEHNPYDLEQLEEIVELIAETVCSTNNTIRIDRQDYLMEIVRSRMIKLNMCHILYVIDYLNKNISKVFNIRNYLLTTLLPP